MKYSIPEDAKILSINDQYCENNMDGLLIETNKGTIKLLIDNDQNCCEHWGCEFLETPDDFNKFIGAKLIRIEDTNDNMLPNSAGDSEWNETQLKIITNKGVLQYAVYNSHNGYYSHTTFLQVFSTIERGAL